MSEITQKFKDGTYTQDELLDWHDSYGENMMYQNSLKNLSEDQFENTYTHQDEDFDYKIGEVNEVPVVYNKQIRPKIFGQNLDDLKEAGQKTVDVMKATPGFLKDFANPVNIGKGLNEGVTNFFNLIDSQTGGAVTSIDNYFKENFPNTLGKSFEYEKPDTAGGITSSVIGQYVVPDLLFRRFLPMFKFQGITSDALTVGLFSSKDEGNIASMISEMLPDFPQNNAAKVAKIITEGLTANEDDSELYARLKNVVSDSGALFILSDTYKIFKNLKNNPEKVQEYQSLGAAATPTTKEDLSSMKYVDSDGFVKTNIVDEDLAISNYERIKFDEGSERPFKVFLKGEDSHQKSFKTQEEAENFINQNITMNKGLKDKNAIVLSKSEKPFYSNVENAISNMTMKSGNGDQILATLNNTSGIKQSEIEDLGLNEFLAGKKKVTKEELDDFIADKSLTTRVKETVLEGSPGERVNDIDFADGVRKEFKNAYDFDDAKSTVYNDEGLYNELTEFGLAKGISEDDMMNEEFVEDFLESQYGMTRSDKANKPTKFDNETLPGGKDYKEILITAPGTPQVYTKHHFKGDVPDGENLIAHARFNTRTINDKKTLFIEEIQSDLHQAGRKQGYSNYGMATDDYQRIYKELKAREQILKETLGDKYSLAKYLDDLEIKALQEEMNAKVPPGAEFKVANAPFKKNWHELTMKRLIKYAVDNDFEAISFTPGSVQNKRYELSQVINKIQVAPSYKSDKKIALYTYDKNDLLQAYHILPEQLKDYVGKDLSAKILKDKENSDLFKNFNFDELNSKNFSEQDLLDKAPTYREADLEIGGEGMKGFYDNMLPTFLKNFGKKYNAKLEKTNMSKTGSHEDLKYGFDDIDINKKYDAIGKEGKIFATYKIYGLGDDVIVEQIKDGKSTMLFEGGYISATRVLREELEGFPVPQILEKSKQTNTVPFMVITPEMKKDILTKGVPIAKVEDREEKTSAIA